MSSSSPSPTSPADVPELVQRLGWIVAGLGAVVARVRAVMAATEPVVKRKRVRRRGRLVVSPLSGRALPVFQASRERFNSG